MSESDAGDDAEEQPPLEQVAAGVTTALIMLVAFGLLALDVAWFWIAFPVGFGGVLPAVIGLLRYYEATDTADQASDAEDAPLETLKRRYAGGEIDEAEFERRLDSLLETESEPAAVDHEATPGTAERDATNETATDVTEREWASE